MFSLYDSPFWLWVGLVRLSFFGNPNARHVRFEYKCEQAEFQNQLYGSRELMKKERLTGKHKAIRADPEVRDAMGRVLGRRRSGAPPRAKI